VLLLIKFAKSFHHLALALEIITILILVTEDQLKLVQKLCHTKKCKERIWRVKVLCVVVV